MIIRNEMTTPIPAVGAAGEQSSQLCSMDIVAEDAAESKQKIDSSLWQKIDSSLWFDGKNINEAVFCADFLTRHKLLFSTAATLPALNVSVPGSDHMLIEIILQDRVGEIEQMGKKTLAGNYTFTSMEASKLKTLAQEALSSRTKLYRLKDALNRARHDAGIWKQRYNSLKEKAALFLAALERAPKRVMEFLREVMSREAEQPERKQAQKTCEKCTGR